MPVSCEVYDAAIVGAGPAGASAARIIAGSGFKVILLDKAGQVGLPVRCAEYVPRMLYRYCTIPAAAIAQQIEQLETILPDGRKTYTPAPGYVLHRQLFDRHLVAEAVKKGAVFRSRAEVLDIRGQEVTVRSRGDKYKILARVIIGADGPRSLARQCLELPGLRLAYAVQAQVGLRQFHPYATVLFDAAFFGGYAWLFPKGKTANVGLAMISRRTGDLQRAWQHLQDCLKIEPASILGRTGGVIPVSGPVGPLVRDNVVLAGDAAGLTHPLSGAGIANAVLSGTMAGEHAVQALAAGNNGPLSAYQAAITEALGKSIDVALHHRAYQESNWCPEKQQLAEIISRSWIAFRGYSKVGDIPPNF